MIRGTHPIYAEHDDGAIVVYAQVGLDHPVLARLDIAEAGGLRARCKAWLDGRAWTSVSDATYWLAEDLHDAVCAAEEHCERVATERDRDAWAAYWGGVR